MRNDMSIETLEEQLNHFDAATRCAALEDLVLRAARGAVAVPPAGSNMNLHIHSFFSYNADGHSPSRIAWEAAKAGLLVAGIVEFDVLDGLEEFLAAGEALALRATVGVESRVFISDYADREINSPGEPGIAYQMGIGFFRRPAAGSAGAKTLERMRSLARRRNEEMTARVNAHLGDVLVDYERDVLPLAPSGNATERHMLAAYEKKGEAAFGESEARAAFWSKALGVPSEQIGSLFADSPAFREILRAKLMKRGGAGYAAPERGNFPTIEEMNAMSAECGALPCATWLDGTSAGEADPEELVAFHVEKGALAINIIPDRNWNVKDAALKKRKVDNLHAIVRAADRAGLVVIHGTERNKRGLKFVDDLGCEALAPIAESLRAGALAAYAHTALARHVDRPLGGEWARETFGEDRARRNAFYAEVGRLLMPGAAAADRIRAACDAGAPEAIIEKLAKA